MPNYYGSPYTKTTTKKALSKAAKQGIIIFSIILALLIAVGVYQAIKISSNSTRQNTVVEQSETREPREITATNNENPSTPVLSRLGANAYIAVVYIEGVIQAENETYNQSWLLDTIEDLTYDNDNKSILLYINSPGGGVYQSDEVYLALEDYKANSSKPVWAYMGPLAASGGYYIACAADTIYANRNTLTGSIGVVAGQSIDLTKLMDEYGIKMTTITAGKNKNMMNINSPLTAEQRAIMQSIADEAYDQFTGIVAESREMNIARVRELSDGRIYTAAQAEQNGLIDWIGSFENTILDMETNLFGGQSLDVQYYRPTYEKNLYDYFWNFATLFEEIKISQEMRILDTLQNALPKNMEYPAYYYRHR